MREGFAAIFGSWWLPSPLFDSGPRVDRCITWEVPLVSGQNLEPATAGDGAYQRVIVSARYLKTGIAQPSLWRSSRVRK
jgi:hypothetical protein